MGLFIDHLGAVKVQRLAQFNAVKICLIPAEVVGFGEVQQEAERLLVRHSEGQLQPRILTICRFIERLPAGVELKLLGDEFSLAVKVRSGAVPGESDDWIEAGQRAG